MVIYQKYTAENGDKRVLAYSDQNLKITRNGQKWDSADDFEWQNRTYTETDEPVEDDGEEPTVDDALAMLGEMGVDVHD